MAIRRFWRRRTTQAPVRVVDELAYVDDDERKESLFNVELELLILRRNIRMAQEDGMDIPEYMLEREAELVEDMAHYKAVARLCQHFHCRERSLAGHTYVWNWGWCADHL